MDIILGATGHVGSVVAKNLLASGDEITVITHDHNKKKDWSSRGAEVEVIDVHDTKNLSEVFRNGDKLFFLNPPADPATDTVKEEKLTVYSILEALKNSNIKKVVAESTYGAQPGDGLGDLGVLQEMEDGLKELGIPTSVIRAAFYMSNWDSSLATAKNDGIIYSLYPEDFKLPMVSPTDLGRFAAHLLREPIENTGIYYVEGPERYSAHDVAQTFSELLNRSVKVHVLEEGEWLPWLMEMGFSQTAAESMVAMTEITIKKQYEEPAEPYRGTTTLKEYLRGITLKTPSLH